jgi:glutamate transport system ATP-binding protein
MSAHMETTGSDVKEVNSTPSDVPMISIKSVNKHFGALHVLKDIDLDVDRGEVIVVLGPSGSDRKSVV